SVSKKPSCSTLVSSSPIGLPPVVKALRSTASTPSPPFSPMSRNWLPSRMKAAAQVSIRSSAWGGKPLFLTAAASAARFFGGTRGGAERERSREWRAKALDELHHGLLILGPNLTGSSLRFDEGRWIACARLLRQSPASD